MNESHSNTLTSAILKVDVLCDIAMISSPNVLTTQLHDILYNQFFVFYLFQGLNKVM